LKSPEEFSEMSLSSSQITATSKISSIK